jgi:ubiquinone biosynthesis protein
MSTISRLAQLAWVTLKYGLLAEISVGPARRLPRAVRLRLALEELGATWIKLGQALALRYDLLPPDYCEELFKLLNAVAPFPYEAAATVIRDELGADVGELFATFEEKPFASASIGQVHRATLPTGESVAVKVQRPKIERLLATDVNLMYRLARVADLLRIFGGTRTSEVVDEFAGWLNDEVDYTVEAMNAFQIRENAQFDSIERDPKIFLDYTRRRVLTMEYLEGIPVSDIMLDLRRDREGTRRRLEEQGYDLDLLGSRIVWNFLNQTYAIGLFHADLHPANLLVLPGNKIGYVDFGIIGRLEPSVRQSLVLYAQSLFKGDVDRAVEEFTRWVTPSPSSPPGAADELKILTRRYLFDLRTKRRSPAALTADYQVSTMGAVRRYNMSLNPAILAYLKTVITIDSVTYELSPNLDLANHQLRFFSAMTLKTISGFDEPPEIADTLIQYRYRVDRALDAMDSIVQEENRLNQLAGQARGALEWLGILGVLALIILYIYGRAQGLTHGLYSAGAGIALVFGVILYLFAFFGQTRKLPVRSGRRRSRRTRRRRSSGRVPRSR